MVRNVGYNHKSLENSENIARIIFEKKMPTTSDDEIR